MYQLFTDTDTDVTPKIAEEYGYKLISMPYVLKGKDIYPYVDFEEFDQKVFYDTLRSGEIPKTFALSPENISNILNLLLRKVKTFCTCIFRKQ